LVSVTISDTESDSPYQLTIGGTNGSSINAVPQNSASSSWQLQASSDLSAGSYSYDVTVTDNYGKSTSYSGRSLNCTSWFWYYGTKWYFLCN
jgi:Tfp pilus assembly protein PilW